MISRRAAGALTTTEIDAAMAFAEAEKSAATRKAYATDWADFAAWCHARGASPLPAHPGLVATYLSDLAQAGRKASTVGRRAAAIAQRHKLAGVEPPTNVEGVKAVLRGIRRTVGTASDRKSPATGGCAYRHAAALSQHARGQARPGIAELRLRRCLPPQRSGGASRSRT
jgi:hypothetical protein